MMRTKKIFLLISLFVVASAYADQKLKLNPLFCDNMVLQRNATVPIWGTAAPGERIAIKIAKQSKVAIADKNGKWMVKLDPMPAGGPFDLTVLGNTELKCKNVMLGEVWVCSGQSNMEWWVARTKNAKAELKNADYPEIRLFQVSHNSRQTPQEMVSGTWKICTPKNVWNFSAVGYFFGRDLYQYLNVPIGLIGTYWGGTPVEAWTKRENLQDLPVCQPILDRFNKALRVYPEKKQEYDSQKGDFLKLKKCSNKKKEMKDPGITHVVWASSDYNTKTWKTFYKGRLPVRWSGPSVVWMRCNLNIKKMWAGKDIIVRGGQITGATTFFYNGQKVTTIAQIKRHDLNTVIPGALVRPGNAVLAIRVFTNCGMAEFSGNPIFALKNNPLEKIPLSGNWEYKTVNYEGNDFKLLSQPRIPVGPDHFQAPSGLYNGMIYPLIPYAIRGVIWYQGEANISRAYQYREIFKTMISSWRHAWNQGDFPFLTVQLANLGSATAQPQESALAELREAQSMSLKLPNTGLAVTIDIGHASDIHPRNKQDVGKRLALNALNIAYGKNIICSGPSYKNMITENGKIEISFNHVGNGLVARGGALKGFAIAGKDKVFTWAKTEIRGKNIIVWNENVKNPEAVRYAWGDNPEGCNLYNKEGLPGVPFRTDTWKGVTAGKK